LRSVDGTGRPNEVQIDLEVAPPTRIAAYMHGGDAHFAVDREVAASIFASVPGGIDGYRAVGRAGQAFLERVVHHLTDEAGVDQFLVTGCNLSGEPNVHDLAQATVPRSRVVYVVLDPVMLAHAHSLGSGVEPGATAYVQAKMRDVEGILGQASATLDLDRPVAVLMPANLSFVRDERRAHQIVDGLMGALPAGSHLMLTLHTSDLLVEEHAEMYRRIAELAAEGRTWGLAPRSHAEVVAFFAGLELLEPGVVPMDEWRAAPDDRDRGVAAVYGALGRK
jgi:S-adenosyl methyltransferase